MLHEFAIKLNLSDVDEAIEKLNLKGYYNSYYEQPIEQFQIDNGYNFTEVENGYTILKVILEDLKSVEVEKMRTNISSILNKKETEVDYQLLEMDSWQQEFPVIDLKNGWFIQPRYSTENIDGGKVIQFEPPRAFGSGLHQTTQDCLRIILNKNLEGKQILDVGTGAGLLTIAAALIGAEKIVAIDIEDVEAEVLYNAHLNNVEEKITVLQNNALHSDIELDGLFDWIFINIGAHENKDLLPFVDTYLVNKGSIILSGMVEWNYKEVVASYKKHGYLVLDIIQSDEWITAYLTNG